MPLRTLCVLACALALSACSVGPTKSDHSVKEDFELAVAASTPEEFIRLIRLDPDLDFLSDELLRTSWNSIPLGPQEEISPVRGFFRQCSSYKPLEELRAKFRTCKLREHTNGISSEWVEVEVLRAD
jgi:hypothetical protein